MSPSPSASFISNAVMAWVLPADHRGVSSVYISGVHETLPLNAERLALMSINMPTSTYSAPEALEVLGFPAS